MLTRLLLLCALLLIPFQSLAQRVEYLPDRTVRTERFGVAVLDFPDALLCAAHNSGVPVTCATTTNQFFKYERTPTLWKLECMVDRIAPSISAEVISIAPFWHNGSASTVGSASATTINGETVTDGQKYTFLFNEVAPYADAVLSFRFSFSADGDGQFELSCKYFLLP